MLNYHQEKETRLLFTCSSRCPSFTDLTGGEGPARCLETVVSKCCCEEAAEKNPGQNQHRWLRTRLVEKLPAQIRKGEAGGGWCC